MTFCVLNYKYCWLNCHNLLWVKVMSDCLAPPANEPPRPGRDRGRASLPPLLVVATPTRAPRRCPPLLAVGGREEAAKEVRESGVCCVGGGCFAERGAGAERQEGRGIGPLACWQVGEVPARRGPYVSFDSCHTPRGEAGPWVGFLGMQLGGRVSAHSVSTLVKGSVPFGEAVASPPVTVDFESAPSPRRGAPGRAHGTAPPPSSGERSRRLPPASAPNPKLPRRQARVPPGASD